MFTLNPKASVITDAGDLHARDEHHGIYQRRLQWATHQLHCTGRRGLVKEVCHQQPQDKICDKI